MESFLLYSKPKEKTQERRSFEFLPKFLYKSRNCKQDDFSILVFGGRVKYK